MKICYVCADLGILLKGHNGSAAHIRNLIRSWTLSGHDVIVVSPSMNADADLGVPIIPIPKTEVFDALSSEYLQPSSHKSGEVDWKKKRMVRAFGHLWNNVALERVLRETLPDYQPDFIYERYSPFCIAGVIMAKRLQIPHILNVNAPLAWEGTKYRKQALRDAAEELEKIAFNSATHIVTTCRELKDDLTALGIGEDRVSIAPMGVDVDSFTPDGAAYRSDFEGKTVIGFVGSLKPWHGLEILCGAFRKLSHDSRFHLLIVGDGPMSELIHKLQAELPGQVSMPGNIPQREVPKYVRAMDIAVAPYPALERFYFSPLKVLEYMAAGRAIVASRIGQIAELIRDNESGLLVPPGDVDILVKAIQALASDHKKRQSLGSCAALAARREHTWMHRAETIIGAAKNLIDAMPSSGLPAPLHV